MATIQIFNRFISESFENIFNEFFKDKYPDEELRNIIIEDIYDLVRNEIIAEIYFCYYESSVDKITNGYAFGITYNNSNVFDPMIKEIPIAQIDYKDGTEKLLIVKLNDKFENMGDKKDIKVYELKSTWNYISDQDIEKRNFKQLFNADGLQVEIGEISDE